MHKTKSSLIAIAGISLMLLAGCSSASSSSAHTDIVTQQINACTKHTLEAGIQANPGIANLPQSKIDTLGNKVRALCTKDQKNDPEGFAKTLGKLDTAPKK